MSSAVLSESEILERFAGIVAKSLQVDRAQVTPDACLSDLGAESLDLLEITMEAEDEFTILMPQKDILQIGQGVFGPGVLVSEGRLTEHGVRFLQHRMPECGGEPIVAGMPVADVARQFQRIRTWVRVIQGLIEQRPSTCPSCRAGLSKAVAGRFTCACGTTVDLPAGDDLNLRWVEEYYRSERDVFLGGPATAV